MLKKVIHEATGRVRSELKTLLCASPPIPFRIREAKEDFVNGIPDRSHGGLSPEEAFADLKQILPRGVRIAHALQ
jgi:hypothetical protein